MKTHGIASALIGAALVASLTACSGANGIVPDAHAARLPAGAVSFHITLPGRPAAAGERGAKYIAPTTNSVTFSLISMGGVPLGTPQKTIVPLTLGGNCTGSGAGTSCTVNVNEPVGLDSFVITLQQAADGSGTPLAYATKTANVSSGGLIYATLNPVITAVAFSPASASRNASISGPSPMTLNYLDAAGDVVTDPGTFSRADGSSITFSTTCTAGGHLILQAGGTNATPFLHRYPSENAPDAWYYDGGLLPQTLTCTLTDGALLNATFTLTLT